MNIPKFYFTYDKTSNQVPYKAKTKTFSKRHYKMCQKVK